MNDKVARMVSPVRVLDDSSPQTPRLIAFYLPQFHPVPENDVFWGKGFTEWTNVVQAQPLFPGHYQPRLPADLGFYDLRLPEVRQAQADLAREHGIYGFCYHHYWFKGRRILDRPLNEVLASGHPDFPFCLCWANHNWMRNPNNAELDRLIAQEYSEDDDRDHIRWLLGVFQDERYIKVAGRPLLLIYTVQALPNPLQTITMWKEEARRMGVAEPYIYKVETYGDFTDPREFGCDAAVEFPPLKIDAPKKRVQKPEKAYSMNRIFEYRGLVAGHLGRAAPSYRRFPCVVPSWDNTPRFRFGGATIYRNSTPELYEHWLKGAIGKTSSNPHEEQIVFINAWNEWAEGAYLEPDLRYGRAYLEATRRALRASSVEIPAAAAGGSERISKADRAAPAPLSIEKRYSDLLNKYTQLQQRLTEQLGAEEHSALPQKLRDYYEDLELRYMELQQRHTELGGRHKELVRRHKELAGRYMKLHERHKKLLRLDNALGKAAQRALQKLRMATVLNRLRRPSR